MSHDDLIDKLWGACSHGTRREDIAAAYEAGVAAERGRWGGVEQYLIAAADGSMSRNNSESLAVELLAQLRATLVHGKSDDRFRAVQTPLGRLPDTSPRHPLFSDTPQQK